DIGSPRVDGPPIMPEDLCAYIMAAYGVPPSPDYIPGPEVPPSLDYIPGPEGPPSPDYLPSPEEPEQAPPSPIYLPYVSEPMYPEYMPPEDDVLLVEEQPLHAAASPTAELPGYIPESDPEEDLEEDPADYPADREDDDDDEDEDKDEEEEEEHPAPADSVPPIHRMTARISIQDEPSISLPLREEVERLLALTTPPPSLLTPLSSPLPQIPSPPLPASPLASVLPASPPASPISPLGYRAAKIRLRAETPSTSHPLPLPTSSLPLQLLSSDHRTDRPPLHLLSTDRKEDRPEVCLPPQKRLCSTHGPRYEIGESSFAAAARPIGGRRADYGFVVPTMIQHDSRFRRLCFLEAWGRSIEVSYMARSKIMALRSVVMGQQAVISQLQAADRRSQAVTSEMLQADHRRQAEIAALQTFDRTRQEQLVQTLTLMQSLQGQVTTLQGQVTALQGQQGPSGGPAQPVAPEEAGSSS
ncbi:hypothetical protein Tco_0944351, partial [Tanacetum coccineum]